MNERMRIFTIDDGEEDLSLREKIEETQKERKPEDITLKPLRLLKESMPIAIEAPTMELPDEVLQAVLAQVKRIIEENSHYTRRIVSDEEYEEAKKEKRTLSSANRSINNFRLNITKYIINPFVNQCNQASNALNAAIVIHDEVIDEYAEAHHLDEEKPVYKLSIKADSFDVLERIKSIAERMGADVKDLSSTEDEDGDEYDIFEEE